MTAMPPPTIGEFIKGPSHAVAPDETIRAIAQILSSYEIGVVIVERDNEPVGVVSERDLVRGLTLHDEFGLVGSYLDMTASDLMSSDPIVADASTTKDDAVVMMRERELRHLLVATADGYGVVSIRDLL